MPFTSAHYYINTHRHNTKIRVPIDLYTDVEFLFFPPFYYIVKGAHSLRFCNARAHFTLLYSLERARSKASYTERAIDRQKSDRQSGNVRPVCLMHIWVDKWVKWIYLIAYVHKKGKTRLSRLLKHVRPQIRRYVKFTRLARLKDQILKTNKTNMI